MPVRKPKNQPTDSTPRSTSKALDPFSKGSSGESLLWKTARFLEKALSHHGMFWLGVALFLLCLGGNIYFYFRLLTTVAGYWWLIALVAALLISGLTTLFEVMPAVMNRSKRNILHQIFLAGSKPQELPNLNPKVAGDAEDLMKAYRNNDRDTRNFFGVMKWIAIGLESCIAFVFLGSIGAGMRALIGVVAFLISIFGCEWGASIALRAAEWELPPAIRNQLDELIANWNKPLNLTKIDS